ncbi:MAG: LPS export ABC transporter periplasmic protein LptC [Pseudomonadales bacterium]|mgnify:CR=1 FL=1|nr:LPS export ABC transporter periplasmic protein LptC [Pseudomonadales bacterium]
MSHRQLVILFGTTLTAIIFAIAWFSQTVSETSKKQQRLADSLPDFIIRDFNSQQFNADGKLQYEMEANQLIHYPTNDATELDSPVLKFESEVKGSWTVQSERGFVATDGNIVELNGNVLLTRQATLEDSVTMATETLYLHLDKEFAETTKPVIISSTNTTVEAVGMQADFTDNRLILVSKVRGRHEIPSKP